VKTWETQAKDIIADVTLSDKYKSLALHAEVKFAEALERCMRVQPPAYTANGEEKPSKLKTAVCCQLLGEFAELCGPFASVLKNLRDELIKSVYSGYYVSEKGLLVFDQLPWFTVTERLEKEKEMMLEEREKLKQMMEEQQDAVTRIEEQLSAYQRAMAAAQAEAAAMRNRLESLTASEESARLEAKTGREELKRARKEWIKMKDDLDAEKDAHQKLKDSLEASTYSLKAQVRALTEGLAEAQLALQQAQAEVEQRLPLSAVEGLQQQLADTHQQLLKAKSKIRDLEGQHSQLESKMGGMTPRPSFGAMGKHGIKDGGTKTQSLVQKAAEKLDAYIGELEATRKQLKLMEAVARPEPLPAAVQLSVVTDSSAYFITEGEDPSAAGRSTPSMHAESLGSSVAVPRCLRWHSGEKVPMRKMDLHETETTALSIWKAKQTYERSHPTQPLHGFLYHYFAAVASSASPEHSVITRAAYSLYHACATHARTSALVRLFWNVLCGDLSEHAFSDQQLMVRGLLKVIATLPQQAEADGPCVSNQDVREALDKLFPARQPYKVMKLKEAFATQFRGQTVPVAQLHAALHPLAFPESVHATEAVEAGQAGDGAGSREQEAVSGADAAAGPFMSLLLTQHLDDLESYATAAASSLVEHTPAGPGPGSSIPADAALQALRACMPEERALRCMAHACRLGSFLPGELLGLLSSVAQQLDATMFSRVLLSVCLVKCDVGCDVMGVLQWAKDKAGTGQQGAGSIAQLPEVA